ncbi:MAG: hypothetical protein KAG92_00895, partial [Deltaproteobacteria bacterium]|nr:hypothetical protein [Deltaproteobacteria bacterium]
MRKINLKKRFGIALLLLLLLFSCAGPGSNHPTGINGINTQLPDTCWLLQDKAYRLRQSARLEYLDKKEIFEGFMELDLKQSRAHLIIFTTLGVTLLNIEIENHSFSFADTTGSKSPGRQEKRFATAVATA